MPPEPAQEPSPLHSAQPSLFGHRPPEPPARSPLPWIVAGATVLLVVAALLLGGRGKSAHRANTARVQDAYAEHVGFSGIVMSESTSLSGGKSTFIDGQIHNGGGRTLTGATVQVLFSNDEALPAQVETLPLTLIRTRDPYVDTEPVSAAPIAPGETRPFRLIFENIGANWNQQLPEIHLVQASLR